MFDWAAIVLGVIEGITEFLPISSTGHLLIAEHWLGRRSDVFNVDIQAGAMLSVTIIYWPRLKALGCLRDRETRMYLAKLVVSFATTSALGLLVKKLGVALPETPGPVAWALLIGGFRMVLAEWVASHRPPALAVTWTVAIAVGIAQIVAGVFPGTSRSGATIFAAMLFGTNDRRAATEFAFLVGIPTTYAASAYQLFDGVWAHGVHVDWSDLAMGFLVSAFTAFAAVTWLLRYIQSHRYTAFAVYRIVVGAALLA